MENEHITKELIIEAENNLFSAQLVSDVDVLDKLLHNDLVALAPTGQILTKQMDLDSHRAKTMIIEDASTEIDSIRIIGDTAVTVVTMTAKGKMMETPLEGTFRYIRTWKLVDNTLKVIGAGIMQLP